MKKMNFNLYGGKSFIIGSLAVSMLIIGAAQGMNSGNNGENNRNNRLPVSQINKQISSNNSVDAAHPDEIQRVLSSQVERSNSSGERPSRTIPQHASSNILEAPRIVYFRDAVFSPRSNTPKFASDHTAYRKTAPFTQRADMEEKSKRFTLRFNSLKNFIQLPMKTSRNEEIYIRIPLTIKEEFANTNGFDIVGMPVGLNRKRNTSTSSVDFNELILPKFRLYQEQIFLFSNLATDRTELLNDEIDLIDLESNESFLSVYRYKARWKMPIKWVDQIYTFGMGVIKVNLPIYRKNKKVISWNEIYGIIGEPRIEPITELLLNRVPRLSTDNLDLSSGTSSKIELSLSSCDILCNKLDDDQLEIQTDHNNDSGQLEIQTDHNNDNDDNQLASPNDNDYIIINGQQIRKSSFPSECININEEAIFQNLETLVYGKILYDSGNCCPFPALISHIRENFFKHSLEKHWLNENWEFNLVRSDRTDPVDVVLLPGTKDNLTHMFGFCDFDKGELFSKNRTRGTFQMEADGKTYYFEFSSAVTMIIPLMNGIEVKYAHRQKDGRILNVNEDILTINSLKVKFDEVIHVYVQKNKSKNKSKMIFPSVKYTFSSFFIPVSSYPFFGDLL